MLALVGILIIVVLTAAYFFLKCDAVTSFATLIAAVLGFILAFGYFETVGGLLLSKGYGGQWVYSLSYLILFILGFAILRVPADLIWHSEIELSDMVTKIISPVCGIITGLIISGVLLIAIGLAPTATKIPYQRFPDSALSTAMLRSPSKVISNADGLVSGIFGLISKGSLSSDRSFAVYHAGFADQIHLNKLKAKDGVYMYAGKQAIKVPKKGARRLDGDNGNLTVVRMEVKSTDIAKGGAKDPDNKISFTLSQVRLICKKKGQSSTGGSGVAVYPDGRIVSRRQAQADENAEKQVLTGVMDGRILLKKNLDEVISLSPDDFKFRGKTSPARVDLAFDVPSGMEGVLLEFKYGAVSAVPSSVPASEENEEFLNNGGKAPDGAENSEGQS